MLDHISIGATDLTVAKRFYDAVFAPLGYSCLYGDDAMLGYGSGEPEFWVNRVARGVPADPGSGLHISFVAPTRASVDAFHAAGLAHGGADNGAPGLRAAYGDGYYAAFIVDPFGYRIEAHCQG